MRYARKRSALDALGSLVHRLRTDETAEGEDVVLEAIVALQRLEGLAVAEEVGHADQHVLQIHT